jgi:phytoene dehydrogenase-like protein
LPNRPQAPAGFKVLVIGAGMSGIAAGIKLDEAGYDYTIIEKNSEVGGIWLENVYPGVGVDTPSHFYSYSFEQNPEWSHYHPKARKFSPISCASPTSTTSAPAQLTERSFARLLTALHQTDARHLSPIRRLKYNNRC